MGSGLIDNMARPSENITGFTNYEYSLGGKWLEVAQGDSAVRRARPSLMTTPRTFLHPAWCEQSRLRRHRWMYRSARSMFDKRTELARLVDKFAREPAGGLIDTPRRHQCDVSRRHHFPCDQATPSCGLSPSRLYSERRPDIIWHQYFLPIPTSGDLR